DINAILANMSGAYKEMKILQYTSNKVELELSGEKGWLVASERFAHFPGWEASINGKKTPILKADNAISAVYLNGEKGALVFEYKPASYKKGKLISSLAALALIIYLSCFVYVKNHQSETSSLTH
ncbi:MAG: YfhO family protein, partial [Nanoarchaeota archaeon]